MAVSVRYVHKQIDRAIEDTGSLDADGNEIYIIANPGEGLTALAFTNPDVAPAEAEARLRQRRVRVREAAVATTGTCARSYLWSRLYGNYSGLSQSDENGRTSPNVGRAFDYPLMMFQDGGTPAYGPLRDRSSEPVQDAVHLPVRRSAPASALNQYVASGLPVSAKSAIFPTSNYPVQYLGRGSDGRTPMFSQTDLFVQHELQAGGHAGELQVSFNVLNLFNQETAVSEVLDLSERQRRHARTRRSFYARPADFER